MTLLTARLAPFAWVVLAGLGQALSIGAPWSGRPLWWLQVASLAVLAWQLQQPGSWRHGALLGWVFATAWLCGTFWWLFISLHTYGGLAAPLAALAVFGLAVFLSSYYALACGASRALGCTGQMRRAAIFAALWLVAELMRVTWFTGFPWGAGGYAHVDGPLAFLAPYVGVHAIGWVAAFLAFGVSLAARRGTLKSPRYWALAAVAVGSLVIGNLAVPGENSQSQGQRLSVSLLQGNIPQDEKFRSRTGVPLALAWYSEQLRQSTATLVVTPETAIPLLPKQLPDGYLTEFGRLVADGTRAALIGIPLGSFSEGYTNSVIGLKAGAGIYRFDKHHLVPFGEFIPPLFKWFTKMMDIPLGDFNRGAVGQPSFEWQGQRLAPNICYEDLFGEELGARFRDPAKAPTIFVNASNIGWFGDTVAIDQHLLISRMRALEFERPMIRATNTGATVIIDHRGRVTHALPRHTRGVLNGEVEGRIGITPYAWWVSRFGLWPLWGFAIAIVLVAAVARRINRCSPSSKSS